MIWATLLLAAAIWSGLSGYMLLGKPPLAAALAMRDPANEQLDLGRRVQDRIIAEDPNSAYAREVLAEREGPIRYREQAFPLLWFALGSVFASCILFGFASLDHWAELIARKLGAVAAPRPAAAVEVGLEQ